MKIKKLAVVAAIQFALFSSFANADTVGHLLGGSDSCSKLPGTWKGGCLTTALGGNVHCKFLGHIDVTALPKADSFHMLGELHLDPDYKSSKVCENNDLDFTATCINGVVTIKDTKHTGGNTTVTDLSGKLNDSGTVATINGTVTVDKPPIGRIPSDIKDLILTKQ
ncbi:MAG: hypothetical protein ABI597_00185 [Gammaproteobacteria bacterium]